MSKQTFSSSICCSSKWYQIQFGTQTSMLLLARLGSLQSKQSIFVVEPTILYIWRTTHRLWSIKWSLFLAKSASALNCQLEISGTRINAVGISAESRQLSSSKSIKDDYLPTTDSFFPFVLVFQYREALKNKGRLSCRSASSW